MVNRPDRPPGLEFRAHTYDSPSNASMTSLSLADLPSPRAGEIPPALSPLDALALQGRLLARRFEQESKAGRRMSRLAPLTIQNEFGNRSGYFSSLSNSAMNSPNEELPPPISPGYQAQNSPREQVSDRHRSIVPQFGGNHDEHRLHNYAHQQPLPIRNNLAPIGEFNAPRPAAPQGYFDIPRTHSPEPVEPRMKLQEATPVSPSAPRLGLRPTLGSQKKQVSMDSLVKPPQTNLIPPRSSSSQRSASPSIRPVAGNNYDEAEEPLSNSYDSLQQRRNLSPSSSFSRGHSPYTPGTSIPRSPSVSSEYSTNGSNLPRPAFNFSRPMSRTSTRPSIDTRAAIEVPSRQTSDESAFMRPSFESHPRRQDSAESPITNYASDAVHTPVSMTSEDFRRSTDLTTNPAPAPSYTYSKFTLPRGRKLDRQSIGIEDFLNSQITWDQPNATARAAPPSPESPPVSFDRQRDGHGSPGGRDPSFDQSAPSLTSSNSTIRARPSGAAKEISPQEHCDLGIELHEAGELLKSTYHLRLAARAGLPEAMFWYGLACRHGWGMRENKPEALQWFRKAVDSGGLEVADDEEHDKQGQPTDFAKKKQHKAQYAVAIYELGKCYMNGWGTSQDKPLALRCYEIAGNWGDADALVEAGYCYAEGVGAKKDMKRAARFYRAAEAKGVSMVGNSWIYKDKYMDDGSTVSDARSVRSGRSLKKDHSEKKPRDKSRTRTIFGRKKSNAT